MRGSLQHFRKEQEPKEVGNATRCLECPYEQDCAYSAKEGECNVLLRSENCFASVTQRPTLFLILPFNTGYLDPTTLRQDGWPSSVLIDGIPNIENAAAALKIGPYGRCVYECDKDVYDNQVCRLRAPPNAATTFRT